MMDRAVHPRGMGGLLPPQAGKAKQSKEREREKVAILAQGAYSVSEDDPLNASSRRGCGGEGSLTVPLGTSIPFLRQSS